MRKQFRARSARPLQWGVGLRLLLAEELTEGVEQPEGVGDQSVVTEATGLIDKVRALEGVAMTVPLVVLLPELVAEAIGVPVGENPADAETETLSVTLALPDDEEVTEMEVLIEVTTLREGD